MSTMKNIEIGMIVRYAHDWCSEGERKLLLVVKENYLNPATGEMTRWLVQSINAPNMVIQPCEVVDDYMIVPTGFTVDDADNEQVAFLKG